QETRSPRVTARAAEHIRAGVRRTDQVAQFGHGILRGAAVLDVLAIGVSIQLQVEIVALIVQRQRPQRTACLLAGYARLAIAVYPVEPDAPAIIVPESPAQVDLLLEIRF